MRGEAVQVRMGEVRVSNHGVLACYALGSCVATVFYDETACVGGVAHVVLPGVAPQGSPFPGRYAQQAIDWLAAGLAARGADLQRSRAYLVGGARLLQFGSPNNGMNIGAQNIEAVRSVLKSYGVTRTTEDVGGTQGRTMRLEVETGRVTVSRVGQEAQIL